MRIFRLIGILVIASQVATSATVFAATTEKNSVATVQASSGGVSAVPDAGIAGKIKKENGKPAAGAIITLQDKVTGEKTTAKADKKGKYTFARVFPGDYALSATLKDKKSETEELSVAHMQRIEKDLRIQK